MKAVRTGTANHAPVNSVINRSVKVAQYSRQGAIMEKDKRGNVSRCDSCDKEVGANNIEIYIKTGLCNKCYQASIQSQTNERRHLDERSREGKSIFD